MKEESEDTIIVDEENKNDVACYESNRPIEKGPVLRNRNQQNISGEMNVYQIYQNQEIF